MKNFLTPWAGRAALIALTLLLTAPAPALAQVGIGTTAPAAQAALDIHATDKGVLVPRLSSTQRTGIATPPQGLLVYQTDAPEGFYYFGGGAWVYLNPGGGSANAILNQTAPQAGASFNVAGTGTVGGVLTAAGGVGIGGNNVLEFGAGVAGKEASAGKIGYRAFSGAYLDIVGAGTSITNRKVFFYSEGGTFFNGSVGIKTSTPGQALEVGGQIYSNVGGFRFPDNTVQTTAAVATAPQTLGLNGQNLSISGGNTVTLPGGGAGDNLGDAVARFVVNLQGFALTGTGASINGIGLGVRADGGLNLGQNTFSQVVSIGYQSGSAGNGTGNTFVGISSGAATSICYDNTFVGANTGSALTNTSSNTFVGSRAGIVSIANLNTFVGASSGSRNTMGTNNSFLGAESGIDNDEGAGNTFVGRGSGQYNTAGNNNVALGYLAGPGLFIGDLSNTVALGHFATVYASNTVRLGNSSITRIEGQVPFSNPSDARFKYDVQPNVPGLAFIQRLRPITYRFDGAGLDAYARTGVLPAALGSDPAAPVQSGFLAQEVEAAAQQLNYPFDGLHRPANARDHYSLSYAQFAVPLVRAVQELSQQVQTLQQQQAADHTALLTVQAQLARVLGPEAAGAPVPLVVAR